MTEVKKPPCTWMTFRYLFLLILVTIQYLLKSLQWYTYTYETSRFCTYPKKDREGTDMHRGVQRRDLQ